MIKVLLCCGGGFSSSALAVKVSEDIKAKGMEDKLLIWFSPFTIAHEYAKDYDVIMCCPHLRYKVVEYNEEYIKNEKPIYVLPPLMYGRIEPEEIYQDALDILEMFKIKKENPVFFPNEEDTVRIKRTKSYRKTYRITGDIIEQGV